MTLILTRSDLEPLVDLRATIEAVDRAMGDVARGSAVQPAPALMRLPDSESGFLPMAAASTTAGLASVKLLADVPANAAAGRATQRSSLVLVSAETGETLALLDGAVPTRMRTAAASAVASWHLARPESTTLGLVGAGALAVAHVAAMLEVLPIDTVTFWTGARRPPTPSRPPSSATVCSIKPLDSPRAVVESADVVCTLTPSVTPIVSGHWFRPGLHVNAVGARPRPDHREVDTAAMMRSRVFVDHLAPCGASPATSSSRSPSGDHRRGPRGRARGGHRRAASRTAGEGRRHALQVGRDRPAGPGDRTAFCWTRRARPGWGWTLTSAPDDLGAAATPMAARPHTYASARGSSPATTRRVADCASVTSPRALRMSRIPIREALRQPRGRGLRRHLPQPRRGREPADPQGRRRAVRPPALARGAGRATGRGRRGRGSSPSTDCAR